MTSLKSKFVYSGYILEIHPWTD